MSKEAMKLALEAFSVIAIADNLDWIRHQAEQQAAALREALAEQPEQQEPFGYFRYDLRLDAWVQNRAGLTGTPFYTSQPAQRTWVGLTDEEAFQICVDCGCLSEDWLSLLDAIEAKLRSRNT